MKSKRIMEQHTLTARVRRILLWGAIVLLPFGATASGSDTAPQLQEPLPPAPVLMVGAGVLPTSPLSVLDHLDEFLERTLFTLGIPRLRADTLLRSAAERIAELQALDGQGLLTADLRDALLRDYRRSLVGAADVAGSAVARGGRPVVLFRSVVRTSLAGTDALTGLFDHAAGTLGVASDDDEPVPMSPVMQATDVLAIEDTAMSLLLRGGANVPSSLVHLLTLEHFGRAERLVAGLVTASWEQQPTRIVTVGGEELGATARHTLAEAAALIRAGEDRGALPLLRDVRDSSLWVRTGALTLDMTTRSVAEGASVVDLILHTLTVRGLLSPDNAARARDRALGVLRAADATAPSPPEAPIPAESVSRTGGPDSTAGVAVIGTDPRAGSP